MGPERSLPGASGQVSSPKEVGEGTVLWNQQPSCNHEGLSQGNMQKGINLEKAWSAIKSLSYYSPFCLNNRICCLLVNSTLFFPWDIPCTPAHPLWSRGPSGAESIPPFRDDHVTQAQPITATGSEMGTMIHTRNMSHGLRILLELLGKRCSLL